MSATSQMIKVECPACGSRYKVPPEFAGRKTGCRKKGCPQVLVIPQPEGPTPILDFEPVPAAKAPAPQQVVMIPQRTTLGEAFDLFVFIFLFGWIWKS